MQKLRKNCSIVRRKKMFYNNMYFDTSKIDIDSEINQLSLNSSVKKNKSIERSINLSVERSNPSNRESNPYSVMPRFQSPNG
jgi:hypothetical protein